MAANAGLWHIEQARGKLHCVANVALPQERFVALSKPMGERRKIAQGKLAGKTARQIAAEVGLSESSVEKAAKDPRTSLLIQRLKERDEEVLRRCWKKAVASIESHLDSDDQDLVRDARKDLLRYVTAGDPQQIKMEAPTKAANGDFTLAELLSTLRRIQESKSST